MDQVNIPIIWLFLTNNMAKLGHKEAVEKGVFKLKNQLISTQIHLEKIRFSTQHISLSKKP